jgi:hypothetical protein
MNDRSRIVTAACVGGALGAAWGWLYLTNGGSSLRSQVGPALDHFTDSIKEARSTVEKGHAALAEARTALGDVVTAVKEYA